MRTLETGDVEAQLFKLQAPFHIKKIKLNFREAGGTARIHLYGDMLGSVPMYAPWTESMPTVEYMEPIDVQVTEPGWVEVDVSDRELIFLPGTKVWAGFEHLTDDHLPSLYYSEVKDETPQGQPLGTARWYEPEIYEQYGDRWGWVMRYYMIRLEGTHFCQIEDAPYFTNVTAAAGLNALGQHRGAWADLDGDGWDDLILTKLSTAEQTANVYYYRNNGDGTFTEQTAGSGLEAAEYTSITAIADIDNDGDKDLISIVAVPHDPELDTGERTKVLLNDGTGHFTEQADTGVCNTDANFSSAGFGDYNRDGYLDLYVGSWLIEYPYAPSDPDFLFRNNADLTFTDVSVEAGIREDNDDPGEYKPCYGVTWVDYNDDGWYDVFVSNYGRESNYLLENQGDNTFVDVASDKKLNRPLTTPYISGPGNTFGADFGDINNDGYFDAMLSDIAHPRYMPGSGPSSINVNDGPPDFAFTWSNDVIGFHADEGDVDPSFIDFNNDGRLDMFISSLYSGHYSRLYEQQEDGTWLDVTYWSGTEAHAAAGNVWADYDRDGDVDLCNIFEPRSDGVGGVWIFRNEIGNANNWLQVKLIGTDDNADAIGAKITVTAGELTQVRYVQGPRGHYGATPSFIAHFGLAQEAVADTIEVRWPNGDTQTWTGVDANARIVLTQGDAGVGAD
jgi:hypothetical protein